MLPVLRLDVGLVPRREPVPDTLTRELGIPHIQSASRRLNIMLRESGENTLELAVCDPTVQVSRDTPPAESPVREVRITLTHRNFRLLEAESGLPQANPPLNAEIADNVLRYTTCNGVTDSFVITY